MNLARLGDPDGLPFEQREPTLEFRVRLLEQCAVDRELDEERLGLGDERSALGLELAAGGVIGARLRAGS